MTRITIAGGTGTLRDALPAALAGRGIRVRMLMTDSLPARSACGGDNIEFMSVDPEDSGALRRAFRDTDRACLWTGAVGGQARYDLALIDAALQAGVPYLVNVAQSATVDGCGYPGYEPQGETDAYLAARGGLTTLVRPSLSMDRVFAAARSFVPLGQWGGSAGSGRAGLVDDRDVVAATARILLEGEQRHGHKTYRLTGPAAVTMGYIADYLSESQGRLIKYHYRTVEEQRRVYQDAGLTSQVIDRLLVVETQIRQGMFAATTTDVQDLTGLPARSVIAWIREHRADFAPRPAD